MKCDVCRGACCESFSLPVEALRGVPNPDAMRWVELHATKPAGDLRFECRCTALTTEGRCGIYETRPNVCRIFTPGGLDCLETVLARRSAEDYERIREEGYDPKRIHD